MATYTDLKQGFDHLQKRAIQLFEIGKKREGELETAVANAWKQFDEIEKMNDIDEIKNRAVAARSYMENALKPTPEKSIY